MGVKMVKCPMHEERTASCAHYDEGWKTHWHCFGCSWHADGVKYLIDVEGMEMRDAIQEAVSRGWREPDSQISHNQTFATNGAIAADSQETDYYDPVDDEPPADSEYSEYAIKLWTESIEAAGTPVEAYFAARNIPRVPGSIRT